MSQATDFILPSCPGIPESMWLTASALIDGMIKRGWVLLGIFFTIHLITDAIRDVTKGQFSLGIHIKTFFHVFTIGCFFRYYKPILMFVDHFVDSLCIIDVGPIHAMLERSKNALNEYAKNRSWFELFKIALKMVIEFFPSLVSLLTHAGAIHFMHYVKAVTLLIMSLLGPFAALFSLLPGPFKKAWTAWAGGYFQVTCWSITLHIFDLLSKAFLAASLILSPQQGSTFFSQTIGHTFLSIVLYFCIFLTPSWTAKFTGMAFSSKLATTLKGLLGRTGKTAMEWGHRDGKVMPDILD